MTKKLLLTAVLVAVTGPTAFAQRDRGHVSRPRVIARRCAHDIRHLTYATVREMHARGNRCAAAIGDLLEQDKVEEAQQLARQCSQGINGVAENGIRRIRVRAERCLSALTELEAPDRLKAFVRHTADAAITTIREHLERVLRQLRDALENQES